MSIPFPALPPLQVLMLLRQWLSSATHPMGPVDPVPEPRPGNPLPPEPVGPHPTPEPV